MVLIHVLIFIVQNIKFIIQVERRLTRLPKRMHPRRFSIPMQKRIGIERDKKGDGDKKR
jgi:hypothetical protein